MTTDNIDLFMTSDLKDTEPLASRMRPRTLDEFIGQDEIVGDRSFLRQALKHNTVPSIILFGPPGTGKTTLAKIIAETSECYFESINAVTAGIADLRTIIANAKEQLLLYRRRTIVFLDEIHRFNKGQQDVLLPVVEDGRIILIGATTENPYFEINKPLLSRTRVIRLKPLSKDAILQMLRNALNDSDRGLGHLSLQYDDEILAVIADVADGDARTALNILEQCSMLIDHSQVLDMSVLINVIGEKIVKYDKNGDNHYDTVSAFIKSMRGSDPDAAIHYLARMLTAGEDINFIGRRLLICASEDVGNADPQALPLAVAAVQAANMVGMPEARIILAQAVAYIACANKSNSSLIAIDRAMTDINRIPCGEVPLHLRDAHYKGAAKLGHGVSYLYPHDYENHYVDQQYMPEKLKAVTYYHPSESGFEANIKKRLKQLKLKNKPCIS